MTEEIRAYYEAKIEQLQHDADQALTQDAKDELREQAEALGDQMHVETSREAERNDDEDRRDQRDNAAIASIEQLRDEAETYNRNDAIGKMHADHKLAEADRIERRLQMVREDRKLRD